MKTLTRISMAAAIALAVPAGLSAPAMAQALSPEVGEPLQEASDLARQGNTSAAMSRVNAAREAAAIAPSPTGTAACIACPRSFRSRAVSASCKLPAAQSALYSPRL